MDTEREPGDPHREVIVKLHAVGGAKDDGCFGVTMAAYGVIHADVGRRAREASVVALLDRLEAPVATPATCSPYVAVSLGARLVARARRAAAVGVRAAPAFLMMSHGEAG